jgi:hypothetical protein
MSVHAPDRESLSGRRGFARTLAFALLAALGVPAVRLLVAPILGTSAALSLYFAALAAGYLAWIAGTLRRAVGVAALAAAGGVAVLALAPGLETVAVGAALIVAVGRSAFLYRAPQPRLLLVEAALLLAGLATASLLATPGVLGISLAVWGYFLVQSAFFLVARPRARTPGPAGDPFERARERLDALLDDLQGDRT